MAVVEVTEYPIFAWAMIVNNEESSTIPDQHLIEKMQALAYISGFLNAITSVNRVDIKYKSNSTIIWYPHMLFEPLSNSLVAIKEAGWGYKAFRQG
jgi:hypothetical protein